MKISLVLPFYNEEKGAQSVIEGLARQLEEERIDYELVVVENGSVDRTEFILKKIADANPRVRMVAVPVNQGYGWGILRGLSAASGDLLGFLCGDGQISPLDVSRVASQALREPAVISKVKRVTRQDGWKRKIVSRIYNFLFSFVFGVTDTDVNGTPKIFSRSIYNQLKLDSKDWFIDAEFMIKAARMKKPVKCVSVDFFSRTTGQSNVRMGTVGEFLKNMLVCRLKGAYRSWKISPS